VFQLRISLIDIVPAIWRRVVIPQDVKLARLHEIIQITMGWSDRHLHQFKVGDARFAEPSGEDYEPLPIDYSDVSLNQITRYPGSRCVYEYDFGDSWEHLIEVEAQLPLDTVT